MQTRRIKIKANTHIIKCPKCGNNTVFDVHSDQCAEDCCDVWASCKCGYDPTANLWTHRVEDVWGGVDEVNCIMALRDSWNPALEEIQRKPTP